MPWKCPVCGYENPDDANFCLRCGAQKPAQPTVEPVQQPASAQQPEPQQQTAQQQEVTAQQQVTASTEPQQAVTAQTNPQQQEVAQSQQAVQVVTPEPQPVQSEQASAQQAVTQPPTPQQKYYLIFIQTPYAGLINQKVPLNFDIFPSISIGRSPENVIIVPDPEVSRRHAVISLEGGELYIEDLNSTNGTYVYDGKLFQPVKGKQKIAPNSIIKLGNQTIVRIVAE